MSRINLAIFLFLSSFSTAAQNLDRREKPLREWDCSAGEGVIWRVDTGGFNGFPVFSQGKILLGANSARPHNPKIHGERGVMNCFSKEKGELLWQASHVRLRDRHQDMSASFFRAPSVDGNRAYYVNNRGELICLDLAGFRDGKNDGPIQDEEHTDPTDADFIWKLDMVAKLGVYKRDAGDVCSVLPGTLVAGDLVYCVTGNGISPSFQDVPKPDAPSFVAVNKRTGAVVWTSNAPGKDIVFSWSAPVMARIAGLDQIIFPGGDGRLYGFEPTTGRLIWTFDCNPAGGVPPNSAGRATRDFFVGIPAVQDEMLYTALSQEPEMGADARRSLLAIDLGKIARSPEHAIRWKFSDRKFGGSYTTPAIAGDVLFTVGCCGALFALDLRSGQQLWQSDLDRTDGGYSMSPPLVHAGRVIVGTQDGGVFVFEAGREKKCLGRFDVPDVIHGAPVADGDVVYVSTRRSLWALKLN